MDEPKSNERHTSDVDQCSGDHEIKQNQNTHDVKYSQREITATVGSELSIRKQKREVDKNLSEFQTPKYAPQGSYPTLVQLVKKALPERTACRFGCKGNRCKYESSDFWRPEQMAIKGIYSHWITNKILACSRPTTRHTDLRDLFLQAGIRSIFNLEAPDEHIFCGHGNHQSGFSYDPSSFMEVNISIYNFAMEDYGTVKTATILDIMSVMSFAITEGKIAVHCHAGLGRTGFIISCYLVYEYHKTAHEAIHYVRAKRPGSVQMSKQIEAVEEFERFIIPKRRVFTECADVTETLPLEVHIKNQQTFLHGRDVTIFRYIPRILFACCARLVELCTNCIIDTVLVTINRRKGSKPCDVRKNLKNLTEAEKNMWSNFAPVVLHDREQLLNSNSAQEVINGIILSIVEHLLTSDQKQKIQNLKHKMNSNNNGIDEIFEETDPTVIGAIMWSWLRSLKCGVIELLAKMYAYIRSFASEKEGILLLFVIVHILTQSPLPNDPILHNLTTNEKLYDYLISEQMDHKNQQSVLDSIVYSAVLSVDQLQQISAFFQKTTDQFEPIPENTI
ncbi:unnamed protein product [Didymodactylos carnosus]|uniref:Protein tyrosine phosphatase domain-containing protein 1 n=1 Tax=Didymodactylos carnosus TaxID=1234261 RepID=A0A813V8K8_9BILA|nr:unnamed protein product [Didymodactylos carnosus]CAF0834168.1 unnamed protein product [Didymodactylos carnosus]CAF3547878.1 unnamed protein product [Didymodactylos carnosus]CAF3621295.1 unnamed protein product [Didymodactylos carnosus]